MIGTSVVAAVVLVLAIVFVVQTLKVVPQQHAARAGRGWRAVQHAAALGHRAQARQARRGRVQRRHGAGDARADAVRLARHAQAGVP